MGVNAAPLLRHNATASGGRGSGRIPGDKTLTALKVAQVPQMSSDQHAAGDRWQRALVPQVLVIAA